MKWNIIAGFSIFFLLNVNFLSSQGVNKQEDIAYVKVDGFEIDKEWVVHFSRFRSRSWKPDQKKYEPDEKWIRWIKANESKSSYKRKNILPAEVVKNPFLKDEKTILAVRASWDRRGNNWLTLHPSNRRLSEKNIGNVNLNEFRFQFDKLSNNYILLPGKTETLYCYVWGMGYNYKVEAHIKDYLGNLYIIPGGYLNYYGWRNMIFKIPKYVKQISKILPRVRSVKLIKLKIVTAPDELNKGFYTYLDYMHVRTNIYDKSFFGSRLQRGGSYFDEPETKTKKDK